MIYDQRNKEFVDSDGRKVPMKCGYRPDDLAFLIAGVALRPESAQSTYIEILKMMSGNVTEKFYEAQVLKETQRADRISRQLKDLVK